MCFIEVPVEVKSLKEGDSVWTFSEGNILILISEGETCYTDGWW